MVDPTACGQSGHRLALRQEDQGKDEALVGAKQALSGQDDFGVVLQSLSHVSLSAR